MAYVPVPKDLSKIKTKLAFNLTKRQLICFSAAASVGLPAYLLTRGALGNSAAMLLMIGLMLPFFFFAMYEKDGLPLEKVLKNIIRTCLLTFLVVNMAPTRRELDNDLFTVSGIVQKYNCSLKRLDFQQEAAFLSSLPLGHNEIEIQRGMTTSSTAIFVPFMTQELRMDGEAVYYGLNALSHNVIMANRKKLKNPKGVYRKGTGIPRKQQAVRPQAAQGRGKGRAEVILTVVYHRQPNMERGLILCRH